MMSRAGTQDDRRPHTLHTRRLFGGAARMLAAEALLVPVGVVTAAFLSRSFGPEGYGLLTLAFVPVVWAETNVAAALSRPAIKLVGEADDWRAVGASVLRLHLFVGLLMMLSLWAVAAPLAALLGEPALARYMPALALDVPVFCLAQAHRGILVGTGRFRERAFTSAARWVARLVLVVAFVYFSGTLAGAVCGIVSSSLVELLVCRAYVRPRLFGRGARRARELCGYAVPLAAAALCVSLYQRLDLLLLKVLGATSAEAGVYAAAQNLSLLPGLLSFSLAPALLSSLTRALRDGDDRAARETGRQAMRAVLLLAPVAALAAGAAPEIVVLIFGPEFLPAAALLRLLMPGALALVFVSVAMSILAAAGRDVWTLHVAWPLLAGAAVGHLLLIPKTGALGAASVTAGLACAGALASAWLVRRVWHVAPPARTLWRSAAACLLAYTLAALLPSPGMLLFVKLAGAGLLAAVALVALGEFGAGDLRAAWSGLVRPAEPGAAAATMGGAP
jgi:O-antigen/teichoic acid export membrane protein